MTESCNHLPRNKEEMLAWFSCPACMQRLLDGFCRNHPSRYWLEDGVFRAKENCVSTGLAEVMNRDWLPQSWHATVEVNWPEHQGAYADICIYRFENNEKGLHNDLLRIELKWASIWETGCDQSWSMMKEYEHRKDGAFDVFLGFFWLNTHSETGMPAQALFDGGGPLNGLTMPGTKGILGYDFSVIAPFTERIKALKRPYVLLGVARRSSQTGPETSVQPLS